MTTEDSGTPETSYTFGSIQLPTNSESGDAQHNPDVWELRARIDWLVSRITESQLDNAEELVPEYVDGWRDALRTITGYYQLDAAGGVS